MGSHGTMIDNRTEIISTDHVPVIRLCNKKLKQGNVIYNLAFSFFYTDVNVNILDFANELHKFEDIYSVAVLDGNNRIKGIVNRREFFDILGKPYGRDVYKNKNISLIMRNVKSFKEDRNIIKVAEILKDDIKDIDNKYYTLVDENEEFSGIFSTKSLLIYLSEITRNDLELAEKMQKRIVMHEKDESFDDIEIMCYSKMAKGVGGDFYYTKKYDGSRWIAALCDVSGKGISASLLASLLGGIFSIYDFNKGLKEFVVILNNYILDTFEMEKFITGIVLEIDRPKNEMIICDMGHSYFLLCREGRVFNCISDKNNIPIGLEKDVFPALNRLTLKKNDLIVVYSDGVIEQPNERNEEYSVERLKMLLRENADESAATIRKKIVDDIHDFRNNNFQLDDITFMLIRIK
jgi:phosphoserine phosphatase RsbU/P